MRLPSFVYRARQSGASLQPASVAAFFGEQATAPSFNTDAGRCKPARRPLDAAPGAYMLLGMPLTPLRRFKLKDVQLNSKTVFPGAEGRDGDMPVFPEELMGSVETTFFWNIENAEVSTEEELEKLLRLMYDCPEHDFYLFLQKGASKTSVLDGAMSLRSDINVTQTDLRFYRRPDSAKGNFVRIRSDDSDIDRMREAAQTQEYIRFTIALSERKRRDMEVQQHLDAHKAADRSPWMLQPNFNGIGIDLAKAWAHIKGRFRRNRS